MKLSKTNLELLNHFQFNPFCGWVKKFKLKMSRIDYSYSCLRIFKLFGLYYEDLTKIDSGSKIEKCFAYYTYAYYIIKMSLCIKFFMSSIDTTNELDFSKDFMVIILFWSTYFIAVFTFISNFCQRKSDNKIWKILQDVDCIIEEFLEPPNKAKKFGTFKTIFIIYLTITLLSNAANAALNSPLTGKSFVAFAIPSRFLVFHLQLTWIKYIFYANVITQRLNILLSCKDLFKENVIAHQRTLSLLWMISTKVNKVFGYQMVIFMLGSMVMSMFTGYFLSIHILNNIMSLQPIMYLTVPLSGITLISLVCQRCLNLVKILNFEILLRFNNFYILVQPNSS